MTDRQKLVDATMRIAEMEGDLRASISTFSEVVQSLGIDLDSLKKKDSSISDEEHSLAIKSKMPGIMSSLTMAVMGGNFNGATLSKLTALTPIFNKYKYLAEET